MGTLPATPRRKFASSYDEGRSFVSFDVCGEPDCFQWGAFAHLLDGFGEMVPSLNPVYRHWSLDGLVFAGWGKDIFNKCYPHVVRLKQADKIGQSKDKEQARDAINTLKKLLQT